MRLILLAAVLLFSACSDDDNGAEAFDTYQDCYNDHHEEEALPVQEAIVVCCLEHPIAGVTEVCGQTAADCVTYLGTNLSSTSATQTEVQAACDDYVAQKGM